MQATALFVKSAARRDTDESGSQFFIAKRHVLPEITVEVA
jgi:hypothetical protein